MDIGVPCEILTTVSNFNPSTVFLISYSEFFSSNFSDFYDLCLFDDKFLIPMNYFPNFIKLSLLSYISH